MPATPSPWSIERDENGRPMSIGHNHILIASLPGPRPECNARLIAAAPLLLEACGAALQLLHKHPEVIASRCERELLGRALRAAIDGLED